MKQTPETTNSPIIRGETTNTWGFFKVAIDFDGTIVDHRYPKIGEPVPGALETIHYFCDNHDMKVILWTVRSGERLDQALEYLNENDVALWGVNGSVDNAPDTGFSSSPKVFANIYIDDAALGCPLLQLPGFARLCVDWEEVAKQLYAIVSIRGSAQ